MGCCSSSSDSQDNEVEDLFQQLQDLQMSAQTSRTGAPLTSTPPRTRTRTRSAGAEAAPKSKVQLAATETALAAVQYQKHSIASKTKKAPAVDSPQLQTQKSVSSARSIWEQRATADAKRKLEERQVSLHLETAKKKRAATTGHRRKRSRSLGNIYGDLPTLSEGKSKSFKQRTQPKSSVDAMGKSKTPTAMSAAIAAGAVPGAFKFSSSSSASGRPKGRQRAVTTEVAPLGRVPMSSAPKKHTATHLSPTSMDGKSFGYDGIGYHSADELPSKAPSVGRRLSLVERMDAYQSDIEATHMRTRERAATHASDYRKDDVAIDASQKKLATILLTDFAKRKKSTVRERTELDAAVKSATRREEAVSALERLNILVPVFVHKNTFKRWQSRARIVYLAESVGAAEDGDSDSDEEEDEEKRREKQQRLEIKKQMAADSKDPEKCEMRVLALQNSSLLKELTASQKARFKQTILWAIEECTHLFAVNLTQCEVTNQFMCDVCEAVTRRLTATGYSSERRPPAEVSLAERFGPEQLHFESNPVSDRGILGCFPLVQLNHPWLRVLRMGHSFGSLSSKVATELGEVLQRNEFLLKLNVDLRFQQHRAAVDKVMRRNADAFRKDKKQHEIRSL